LSSTLSFTVFQSLSPALSASLSLTLFQT
jgi:hypothetical protein